MTTDQMLFVLELSSVLTKYKATIEYTTDDDGIHISTFGKEVFVGFLFDDAGANLYETVIKKGKP
jgi:hypothetical protein